MVKSLSFHLNGKWKSLCAHQKPTSGVEGVNQRIHTYLPMCPFFWLNKILTIKNNLYKDQKNKSCNLLSCQGKI